MSVRCRRSGLVIAWSRTLTILSPWKRGKADAVVDSEVVLTKVKVLSRSQRNLFPPTDPSGVSAVDASISHQEQAKPSDSSPTTQSLPLDSVLWGQTEDHLDSEDSGLDSPSSPLRSHKSLVHDTLAHDSPVHDSPMHRSPVHSRVSSCDSGNSDQTETHVQATEETKKHPNKCASLTETEETGLTRDGTGLTDNCENSRDLHTDGTNICNGDDSEEFMEACCHLQTRSLSGLGYLEQVCRLVERISRLQDLVLHLQRELRTHRPDWSPDRSLDRGMDRRPDLASLMQRCTCGAADLLLSQGQTQERPKSLSPTDLDQDQRTMAESSARVYSCRESAPCRRRRSRRSLTEDCHKDGFLHREFSERSRSSWGRVQDLVMTRTRSKSRLSSGSLKTSCPQLHRPDPALDPVQLRGSMILLNQSLDQSWLQ